MDLQRFLWHSCLLFHVFAEPCQISPVTPLNESCVVSEGLEGDPFRPEVGVFEGLFSFAFDYLNIEKARENSLYALFVREKLDDHWSAKLRECGLGCPPPRGSNGVGNLRFKSDAEEGVGDAGGVKLTCAKKLGEYPNACSGYFNATLTWDQRQEGTFAHERTMHYGMGLYFFSTYEAEAARRVVEVRFSMGEVDGICGTEYKVKASDASCFGLNLKGDAPPADPPKPPGLSDLVKPALPALHATFPGMGAGAVVAIVLLIVLVIAGLGAGAFYLFRKKQQEEHALRTAREVELN